MAGSYDDEEPGSPWRVALYLDDHAEPAQRDALEAIFLGRAGGGTLRNFARMIGEVHAVRVARIDLDHTPRRQVVDVDGRIEIRAAEAVPAAERVSCGIPGHDHPGEELICEVLAVEEPPLRWELRGRYGFATDFSYSSVDQ